MEKLNGKIQKNWSVNNTMSGINICVEKKKDEDYFSLEDIQKLIIGDTEIDPSCIKSISIEEEGGEGKDTAHNVKLIPPRDIREMKDPLYIHIELIIKNVEEFGKWNKKIAEMKENARNYSITTSGINMSGKNEYLTSDIGLKTLGNAVNIINLTNITNREKIYDTGVK